jgi:hypothetical protein
MVGGVKWRMKLRRAGLRGWLDMWGFNSIHYSNVGPDAWGVWSGGAVRPTARQPVIE